MRRKPATAPGQLGPACAVAFLSSLVAFHAWVAELAVYVQFTAGKEDTKGRTCQHGSRLGRQKRSIGLVLPFFYAHAGKEACVAGRLGAGVHAFAPQTAASRLRLGRKPRSGIEKVDKRKGCKKDICKPSRTYLRRALVVRYLTPRCVLLFPRLAGEPLKGDWPVDGKVFGSKGSESVCTAGDAATSPDGANAGGDRCAA